MKVRSVKNGSINEAEFNRIHDLGKAGLTPTQISKFTGWSISGVQLWKKYKTWSDYCEYKKTLLKKTVTAADLGVKQEASVKTYQTTTDPLVDVLTEIKNELILLRETWESSPTKKKGWF